MIQPDMQSNSKLFIVANRFTHVSHGPRAHENTRMLSLAERVVAFVKKHTIGKAVRLRQELIRSLVYIELRSYACPPTLQWPNWIGLGSGTQYDEIKVFDVRLKLFGEGSRYFGGIR